MGIRCQSDAQRNAAKATIHASTLGGAPHVKMSYLQLLKWQIKSTKQANAERCTTDDLMQSGQAGQPIVLCILANSEVEFYWKYDNEKSSHADMQRSLHF